jgi:hypothetical protein
LPGLSKADRLAERRKEYIVLFTKALECGGEYSPANVTWVPVSAGIEPLRPDDYDAQHLLDEQDKTLRRKKPTTLTLNLRLSDS